MIERQPHTSRPTTRKRSPAQLVGAGIGAGLAYLLANLAIIYPPIADRLWHGALGQLDQFFQSHWHSTSYALVLVGSLPLGVAAATGAIVGMLMGSALSRRWALRQQRARL